MKWTTIEFESITYALRCQNLLKKLKIKNELEKISNQKSLNGCGYKLNIDADIEYIKELLISNKIKFKG